MAQAPPGAQQRDAQKFVVFENFEKMNTAAARQGLPERQLAWQENLQSIAENKLITVPHQASTSLTDLPVNVLSQFNATIHGVDYIVSFTADGAGYATDISSGVSNNFAPAGTFSNPDMTVWQQERILINDPTSGYSTWDGTIFVRQGGVSPVITVTNGGSGYATAPGVTISGGSGTGATAHSVIQGGVVVAVILDNPGVGYQPGDVLTVTFTGAVGSGATGHVTMTGFSVASVTITNPGQFSNPTPGVHGMVVTGGGGTGFAANATVVSLHSGGFGVSTVTITNPGTGYTTPPVVTLPAIGNNPTFQAFLGTEAVASIVRDAGGTGYLSPPPVSIQGGSPAVAATAHATLSGTSVNALILDTAGSGYTGTPDVIIGGGTAAAATAMVSPFVPAGNTIAVFGGRVWLGGGLLLQWTGTEGFNDFDPANAAGALEITDADLVHAITALRNFNNYLFIFGDESVKQIGNISISATGNETLFTILTLTSDQGTIYPLSCASYNRVVTFANKTGVYAILGSSVQKISSDMDGIWEVVDFTLQPRAALIDLNGIHSLGYLVRFNDSFTGTNRSVILTFDGKRWYVLAQGELLISIVATSTLLSGTHQLWGSSGTDITQLLRDFTTSISFRLQTALSHHGNAIQGKKVIRAGFGWIKQFNDVVPITMTVETEAQSQSAVRSIGGGAHVFGYGDSAVEVSGVYLGMTLTGTQVGLTLQLCAVEFQETALWPQK